MLHRIFAALALTALLSGSAEAQSFRFVTYNVALGQGPHEPGIAPGTAFVDRIADLLRGEGADIATEQEIVGWSIASRFHDQARREAQRLGFHHVWALAEAFGWIFEKQGNAIFARWPISGTRQVPLDPGAAGHETRVAVATRVAVPGAPDGVWVVTLHLDQKTESVRLHQLDQAAGLIAGLSGPVILAGDFNSRVGSAPVLKVLSSFHNAQGEPLLDTWAAAGRGEVNTIPWNAPVVKIDWVFATPELRAVSSRVLTGQVLSDHLPVEVDFRLEVPPPPGPELAPLTVLGVTAQN